MISNLRPKAKRTGPAVQKAGGRIVHIGHIHEDAVKVAYRRWAPVYDHTFGKVAKPTTGTKSFADS